MATLTNLETGIVGAIPEIKARVAGPLYDVRQRIAQGYTFANATAMVWAIPHVRKGLSEAVADYGWAGPADLTTLTGP